MAIKQILVVDDHFEMLEFLRSMLELSSQNYKVLGVPSAEEGFLELRRTPFDLLITDLRLPGMSGFDLVRKVQRLKPEMPIIMITGYSSEQGKKEAAELGVFRYFQKPLDTEMLLGAVQAALYGEPEPTAVSEPLIGDALPKLAPEAMKRLETLRSDTGARVILLGNGRGDILFQSGEGAALNVAELSATIADSVNSSFALADKLGSNEPFTIQYQAGQRFDLYSANVGRAYFLAIFFDAESRRGRIGTIWVFAQRAIKDLLPLLPAATASAPTPATNSEATAVATATSPEPPQRKARRSDKEAASPAPEPEPQAAPEPVVEPMAELPHLPELEMALEAAGAESDLDLDSFWDTAVAESETPQLNDDLVSLEEVQAQGLADLDFDAPPAGDNDADLDAFWDEALAEEPAEVGDGFSWEEARRKGLLPSDIAGEE